MIESLDEQGCGIRVVFFKPAWAADRYGHVIAAVHDGVVGHLLSHEGLGHDGWPLSPPLQSLAIERRLTGSVALLVGMSGQSHWSASFEALPHRRLSVDIACRLGSAATQWRLGSTYQTNTAWRMKGDLVEIDVESGSNRQLLVRFVDDVQLKTSSGGFSLSAKTTSHRPVRWKYDLEYSSQRSDAV